MGAVVESAGNRRSTGRDPHLHALSVPSYIICTCFLIYVMQPNNILSSPLTCYLPAPTAPPSTFTDSSRTPWAAAPRSKPRRRATLARRRPRDPSGQASAPPDTRTEAKAWGDGHRLLVRGLSARTAIRCLPAAHSRFARPAAESSADSAPLGQAAELRDAARDNQVAQLAALLALPNRNEFIDNGDEVRVSRMAVRLARSPLRQMDGLRTTHHHVPGSGAATRAGNLRFCAARLCSHLLKADSGWGGAARRRLL